jgi:hypothetical protein
MRRCDKCKACCKVYFIPELKKPANQLCKHCPTAGCKIYHSRPKTCREFKCLWLEGRFPDSFRPDKIGVVFKHGLILRGIPLVVAHELYRGAFDPLRAKLPELKFGIVVVHNGQPRGILGPKGALARQDSFAWCNDAAKALHPSLMLKPNP